MKHKLKGKRILRSRIIFGGFVSLSDLNPFSVFYHKAQCIKKLWIWNLEHTAISKKLYQKQPSLIWVELSLALSGFSTLINVKPVQPTAISSLNDVFIRFWLELALRNVEYFCWTKFFFVWALPYLSFQWSIAQLRPSSSLAEPE